jgi:formate/nitrite transporter FocA (FNT family)
LGTSARDLNSKIIGIYLPIWLFVAVGYEHSIANMFTVQMGMILGANLSVAKYILCVLIPVVLGNILGGGLFVGCTYWYLYLAKKTDTNANLVVESPVNSPYQTVKQYEDAV